MTRWQGVWRTPTVESMPYPNVYVHDGRVSGSITIARSRLPVWAVVWDLVQGGWAEVLRDWDYVERDYTFTADDLGTFLHALMEQRGEFGRLVCVLADVERRSERRHLLAWWEIPTQRRRMLVQLRRCIAVLEQIERRTTDTRPAAAGEGSSHD